MQPPAGVTVVATGKSTARVTWNTVSKVLLYQVTVRDSGNPNKPPVVRNISSTSIDISALEPCSTYTVGVSSVNVFLVPGEPSTVTHNTTSEYLHKYKLFYFFCLSLVIVPIFFFPWCCSELFNIRDLTDSELQSVAFVIAINSRQLQISLQMCYANAILFMLYFDITCLLFSVENT